MEIAFIGTPRQSVIHLALYDLEPTEENYRHVGDVLVALRQANYDDGSCEACTEMGILDEILRNGALEGVDIAEGAALAVTGLVLGTE